MANRKNNSSGSWRKERASTTKNSKSQSNKYRPEPSDTSKRPASGSTSRYWRGGYTRKDGTKVKGHYVNKPS
jgi:hypothetical protein